MSEAYAMTGRRAVRLRPHGFSVGPENTDGGVAP